jgi:phage shock protein A
MWNLSSLAQKAKDAAAQIEHQINDSIGAIIPEEDENAIAANPDNQEETDGYLNVEEECVSFAERDEETQQQHGDDDDDAVTQTEAMRPRVESAPSTGEISFVDLKSALPESFDGNSAAVEEALGRIALLEQMVKSLEEQLTTAKEESEKYYSSNLELMEQVRELKEGMNCSKTVL